MRDKSIIKYIIALGIIAISAVIAGISVQSLIIAQKKSATVINMSGMQRMHSQRIALFVSNTYLEDDSIKIAHNKRVIKGLRNKMMMVHQALLNGNDSLKVQKMESEQILKMYYEAPMNLNEQVKNYLSEVDTFVNTKNAITRKNASITINSSASDRLLASLDQMVNQYVRETNEIIRKMEMRVLLAVFVIITLLILEYLFIFRPLMTVNKNNEQKLKRQNSRLESLNQDLEQFIYAASHDLKTPIRGLHNLMQFLEADFSKELKESSREYIDLIKNRVQRINVLIDGLMRFGAISRERSTQTEYDLDKFLHRFIKNYSSETVLINIVSKLPTLTTNPIWVNEIFSNLIENAIKHSNKLICEITIGHTDKKHYYEFFIKDNGVGVDKKYHDKMFKLFQTLDIEENNPTAGIGLAIVKKIVTELGGKVWISSDINKHFTVFFTIPKKQEI